MDIHLTKVANGYTISHHQGNADSILSAPPAVYVAEKESDAVAVIADLLNAPEVADEPEKAVEAPDAENRPDGEKADDEKTDDAGADESSDTEAAKPTVDRVEIRGLLVAATKAIGKTEVKKVLKESGGESKLGDIPEEKLDAVASALKAAIDDA